MFLSRIILIIGALTAVTFANDCPITANPTEVANCVRVISSAIVGAAQRNLKILCAVPADFAICTQRELGRCVAANLGHALLEQVRELSEKCCPDRNRYDCPIRDSLLRDQRCFAADSLITLSNGNQKPILDIKPGDSLLAYDHKTNNIISTNLLTMLDFQPLQFAFFKQIITTNGQQLSLSSSHLIPTDQHGYVMAKNLHIGMNVYIMNEKGVLVSDSISNISDVIKQGYVAPLTDAGTLIVNNVAASCYATINSHYVAHSVLAPMRWWYRFFGISKESNEMMIGVHWFPKMLYELTSYLIPSVIQN